MAEFKLESSISTDVPQVEVTIDPNAPLAPGVYRFQLIVEDNNGNISDPAVVEVVIKDTQRPTAVIDAPREVEFGRSFQLRADRSTDVEPGKITQYTWSLVSIPERPPVIRPPIGRPVIDPISPIGRPTIPVDRIPRPIDNPNNT